VHLRTAVTLVHVYSGTMKKNTIFGICAAVVVASSATVFTQAKPTPAATPAPAPADAAKSANAVLDLQVQLIRAGFSTGEIDGVDGANTKKALAAHMEIHKKAPEATGETLEDYVLTAEDVDGPFVKIPEDMMEKARLKSLGYTSVMEALGEKFHTAPELLTKLNPGVKFAAGATIKVPKVDRAVPAADAAPTEELTIIVSKSESSLRAYTNAGKLVFYAPVTSGSELDPLPIGDWAVTAVARNPPFNYDPALFKKSDPKHEKATLAPGPNNPVGVVWIDLTKEHYGIHGTPEPGKIGHTSSNGCVRLTNWDALKVAAMVKKGTKVRFVE
jgi:lipoprotein-anchoring transpeptidase ErfK/SrfK